MASDGMELNTFVTNKSPNEALPKERYQSISCPIFVMALVNASRLRSICVRWRSTGRAHKRGLAALTGAERAKTIAMFTEVGAPNIAVTRFGGLLQNRIVVKMSLNC